MDDYGTALFAMRMTSLSVTCRSINGMPMDSAHSSGLNTCSVASLDDRVDV
jgi:hypothetical protein